jgi:hypothetical protein
MRKKWDISRSDSVEELTLAIYDPGRYTEICITECPA